MELNRLFLDTARRLPTKTALVWGDDAHTWTQVREAAFRVAGGLTGRGVRAGDRVGVLLPNGPESVFSHLGIQLAGAIRVPVNAVYTPREASHVVQTAGCSWVVTDSARESLARECGKAQAENSPPGGHGGRPAAVPVLAEELLKAPPLDSPPELPSEAVSLICFTSGTSGKPKGVRLTHANLAANIRGLVEVWDWTERDALLLCLPLMHLHGLGNGLNGWIATGCTLVLHEKFDAEQALAGLAKHQATLFFGVPAMYHKILELAAPRRGELSAMRLWVCGSAPLDRGLEDRFEAVFGQRIVNRYGMTETAMITANPARGDRRRGSVGRALPGMEVCVVHPVTARPLPDGEAGEIVVRGPSLSPGYWNNELDAATRLDAGTGYFHTGDLGYRDADGYVFITGRAKDIIISGGTNIAPLEIEEVLLEHDAVGEAVALGVPHEALGEVLRAIVVCRPGGRVSTQELADWCAARLAKFKRPREFRIVHGPLPRNAMQKLDRTRAKALFGGV